MFDNPFSLPSRQNPHDALDPLGGDGVEGLKLYVPVDNTETAFEQFERSFPGPRELTRRGQLIVAMGMSGCGKSALINRCAYRAMELVKGADGDSGKLQPVVIDARRQTNNTDPSNARVERVSRHVRDFLEGRDLVKIPDRRQELLDSQPNEIYSALEFSLKSRDVVVLVLLPRFELVESLVEYAQLSHPHVVFLAELRGGHDVQYVRQQLESSDRNPAIVMNVGLMDDSHGWEFVQQRYRHNKHPVDKPRLDRQTVQEMVGSRQQPIREFQRTLYLLYEQLRQAPKPPASIDFEYVARFYYQIGGGHQQGTDG
ncbi:hypothetical protein [Actinoplanes sp. DH11]|uniref:hypothetical protein n=1 Tax=Actinoplanes sp. DH11 TaxID=2857011 RepID=UPI001E5FC5C8|nr:hypothetical protein [Actinoplanes sp. DH11]